MLSRDLVCPMITTWLSFCYSLGLSGVETAFITSGRTNHGKPINLVITGHICVQPCALPRGVRQSASLISLDVFIAFTFP